MGAGQGSWRAKSFEGKLIHKSPLLCEKAKQSVQNRREALEEARDVKDSRLLDSSTVNRSALNEE